MKVKQLLKDKKFWFASFLIAWAAAKQINFKLTSDFAIKKTKRRDLCVLYEIIALMGLLKLSSFDVSLSTSFGF